MNKKPIIIICGSTATGKSALAVEIATLVSGEVISADSRQVYTGLDIGSAKITDAEMKNIPHHLIDVADPSMVFSVAQFQALAKQTIDEIYSRGNIPILCGGTGMYIDAAIYNTQFPEVSANVSLRAELEKCSTNELIEKLENLDPDRALQIDQNNRVRLIRAIEIATELGNVPKMVINESAYDPLFIGLESSKEMLQERVINRINDRIPELFDEIKKLHTSGISYERLYSFGLEYRYGSDYIQGILHLEEFKELLATKTWQFAKRQMTWFKRNKEIHWFDPIKDQQKILKLVQDFKRNFFK